MKYAYLKIVLLAAALLAPTARAFPPAPYHLLYGMVRDEYGNPIVSTNAVIILEATSGVQVTAPLDLNLEPGTNYRLPVSMDAGITTELYKSTALKAQAPFKIKVKIGNTTYLPMEMVADFSKLGQPGQSTRLNLTLGEDSDGDGIPDAWERALIEFLGGNKTLADIRPGDDSDGDGVSNLNEYLAGTLPFDEANGLTLSLVHLSGNVPALEFTAIRGRNYVVEGSSDLQTWTAVDFRIVGESGVQNIYRAIDVRLMQVEVVAAAGASAPNFYRLMLR
jgi:hypothetical protein